MFAIIIACIKINWVNSDSNLVCSVREINFELIDVLRNMARYFLSSICRETLLVGQIQIIVSGINKTL